LNSLLELKNIKTKIKAERVLAVKVPIPTPGTPIFGKNPIPRASPAETIILIRLEITSTTIGVLVSPLPCRARAEIIETILKEAKKEEAEPEKDE